MRKSPIEFCKVCFFDLGLYETKIPTGMENKTHGHLGGQRIFMQLEYILEAKEFTLFACVALNAFKVPIRTKDINVQGSSISTQSRITWSARSLHIQ
jgi:hypothetical protein